jgi:hypothetical protein
VRTPKGAPLPVTETGYRSEFVAHEVIETAGGVSSYVRSWLDREAKTKAWDRLEFKWRQLELELLPPKPSARPPRRQATPRTRRAGQGSS